MYLVSEQNLSNILMDTLNIEVISLHLFSIRLRYNFSIVNIYNEISEKSTIAESGS